MPSVTTFALSGDSYVNGLLGSYKWATNSFTFSFPTSGSYYGSSYGSDENTTGFAPLNAGQQAVTRAAFAQYAVAANLSFTEIAETSSQHADLRLAMSDEPPTAWAYLPSTAAEGGDAWFNNSSGYYDSPVRGNYAYTTFLHEIGHSLGLEHPHQGNVMPGYDSMEYTLMSYRSYESASTTSGYPNETWGFAQSLMMYDIAAIQYLYGANFNTNSGNTVYSWSPTTGEMFVNGIGQGAPGGNRIFASVWDGGGVDTYDFSSYTADLRIDLRPGYWTTTSTEQLALLHYNGSHIADGNIGNAFLYNGDSRSLIENAVGGSGHDIIIGNAANNVLRGNGGNDILRGEGGTNTAAYSGSFSDYRITWLTATSAQISDLRPLGPDGNDTVYNIHYFSFQNGVVAAENTKMQSYFTPNGSWTGATDGNKGWAAGDFNGDGRSDIFRYVSGSSGAEMFLSNGSTFVQSGSWTGATDGDKGWHIGDFNGDGRDDIFRYVSGSSGAEMFLSNGSMFVQSGSWTGATDGHKGWSVGDFNGDGRDDIFRYVSGSSGADMFLSNGSMFVYNGSWTGSDGGQSGWLIGDFNGDGRDDLARSSVGTGTEVFLSDGNTFVFSGAWSAVDVAGSVKVGDFNGDGFDDLFFSRGGGAASEILFSNGASFDNFLDGLDVSSGYVVGDFSGDGSYDISRYRPGSSGGDVWLG